MVNAILHVAVIGFHHKRGAQVEYSYPPISNHGGELPTPWLSLPSLALPDGAHNVDHDVTYFLLPSLQDANRAVFGISCYRQIDAKDLIHKSTDVTRNTVQKSVCVLSRVPLFGILTAKLQLITAAYFNERDFAKVEVLSQMYQNLMELFPEDVYDEQAAIMEISVQAFTLRFKRHLLTLFKLLLLEKRILFHISPTMCLGQVMIALISLFPKLASEGLFHAAACKEDSVSEAASAEVGKNEECKVEETTECTSDDVGQKAVLDTDTYGFPLSIFTKGSLFHPYLSISYIDMIRSNETRAYCIGATNALFAQRRDIFDIIVTISENGDGYVDVVNSGLKRALTLTWADVRFVDFIMKEAETNEKSPSWEGGDEWIRLQMRAYLLSLMATVRADLKDSLADFNEAFVDEWKLTNNFRIWSSGNYPDLAGAAPGHPFAGSLGLNDVLLRVEHSVGSSESRRRVANAVANTGKYFADTGTKMKTSISSWFKNSGH